MTQENYFVEEEESVVEKLFLKIQKQYRKRVDPLIIYITQRWIFTLLVFIIFFYRVVHVQGFYVIAYMEGLLALQLTVQFFTPLGIPDIEEDDENGTNIIDLNQLPTHSETNPENEEFKPMIRSVSEFKYWQNMNNSAIISFILTFFRCLDLPVFWPFLLAYFIGLVIVTFKKLWSHSKKYNYNFFDQGKVKYNLEK